MRTNRKALIVGIDHYRNYRNLHGCVKDALEVHRVLERHGVESQEINFDCNLLTCSDSVSKISQGGLKDEIRELFHADAQIALFYFAGHGQIDASCGYLLGSDAKRGDEGVSLADILIMANSSPSKNRVIILDSCHSGIAGASPSGGAWATLSEGLTIMAASTKDQYATEKNGRGLFTTLLVDALDGSAADLTGAITPGSVYAHIDQSLGLWAQRPVFKSNVTEFVALRSVAPTISIPDLRQLVEFFPSAGSRFGLDPTFEPEMKGRDEGMPLPDPANTRKFAVLQAYNRLNLVVPVGAPHMWHAAMESKVCELTPLGEHYRRLVETKRI